MSSLWQINLKKWSCAKCGFSTGRKSVVKRHIANPNIHDSNAEIVSYEEYVTGVRSHVLAPPTNAYRTPPYVTPYRKQLKHSQITSSDIMIPVADWTNADWREKFRTVFSNCIAQDARSASSNQATARTNDGSLLYINYYGYVCRNCFSIGLTYDQKAARAIEDGDHICPPDSNHSPISPDRLSLLLEDLRNKLGELLFDVAKIIAAGKKLVLVGHSEYPDFSTFYYSARSSDFRELERGVIFGRGRLVLDDSKLNEYFKFYSSTKNTFEIQYNNHNFQYHLWLAIQTL